MKLKIKEVTTFLPSLLEGLIFSLPKRMRKNTVDVRSTEDVANLENILKMGPITIVLIYADWCGHCVRFKKNVWSKLLENISRRGALLASIHHDQLSKTSLRDAKIKGYPSVLVVGKDGKPAVFKGTDGNEEPTNAMPNANLETLKKMVNADAETIMKDTTEDPTASMMTPPDAREDVVTSRFKNERQGGGGNLFKILKKSSSKTKKQRALPSRKRHTRGIKP